MAALVPSINASVLVVLDAWEVRAALVSRLPLRLRLLLLRERPTVVVTSKAPPWLRRLRLRVVIVALRQTYPRLDPYPELRRFIGTRHEPAFRQAVHLADEILTDPAYDPRLSQD